MRQRNKKLQSSGKRIRQHAWTGGKGIQKQMRKVYAPCKECGAQPCICPFPGLNNDDDMWAAHCMNCDNQIGYIKEGILNHPAKTETEAGEWWNIMNTEGKIANYDALVK